MRSTLEPRPFRAFGAKDLDRIPQLARLAPEQRDVIRAVAEVLPFRVSSHVLDELVDWSRVPEDPIFQLTFPQAGMLEPDDLARMVALVQRGAPKPEVRLAARSIQLRMNPHPAGQLALNVPSLDGERVEGVQHKYRETVLFFPKQGQTCHAYCTYCFRWAQFAGLEGMQLAASEVDTLTRYLGRHPEVSDVLFTGGDPMVMRTKVLRRYVEPLLALEHVQTIRFGTKALAYWPYRFVTDRDADDLLRLFEEIVAAGKHVAVMAHYSHPRELAPRIAEEALRRIRATGAVIRCQAPLIRHVNDDPAVWSEMWDRQVRLGAVPYYLFVERDTGPKRYFEVPLARALEIYRAAYQRVSGLARTARGPSMSATPGKVLVEGVTEHHGEKVFVLRMIQGRRPEWAGQVFFARYDEHAVWLDQLRPALGAREHFFEGGMRALKSVARALPVLEASAAQ